MITRAPRPLHTSVLAHWYTDAGLEVRRANPGSGWLGWYYWTWAFHGGYPRGNNTLATDYDPARKPLLGFYRGDDADVLDWQCFWLREYGVAGVILIGAGKPQSDPAKPFYWQYQLFHNVPNFKGLRYVMTMPDGSSTRGANASSIKADWRSILETTYFEHPHSL